MNKSSFISTKFFLFLKKKNQHAASFTDNFEHVLSYMNKTSFTMRKTIVEVWRRDKSTCNKSHEKNRDTTISTKKIGTQLVPWGIWISQAHKLKSGSNMFYEQKWARNKFHPESQARNKLQENSSFTRRKINLQVWRSWK